MQEKYLNLHSKLSQMIWIILIATVVINVYLVQRSFDRFSYWDEVINELKSHFDNDELSGSGSLGDSAFDPFREQPQRSIYGLDISYRTLTICWPLILLALFMALRVQLHKRNALLILINQTFKEEEKPLIKLDTYALTASNRGVDVFLFTTILMMIPLLGLGSHLYFGKGVLAAISEVMSKISEDVSKPNDQGIMDSQVGRIRSFFAAQIVITALSMLTALTVNTYSLRTLLKKEP